MPIRHSEVTPKSVYWNRRQFLAGALAVPLKSRFSTTEKPTSFKDITTYNNFYEFGTGKEQPAQLAHTLVTSPWSVRVEGLAEKSRVLDIDEILKMAPLEERIYRMRCVEGWSMVIPWIGFPLSELIKRVQPNGKARYVAFESYYNSKQMPAARWAGIPFPYVEGLRMDEALNPLTLVCVGLYGEVLPKQNGAPVRIVVPWKYGFKSIKSVARIRFVEKEPSTTWSMANPREYGFYSNVNPKVDHPRWSQARERRIGEFLKRDTLLFNGYSDHVAALYNAMDLRRYY